MTNRILALSMLASACAGYLFAATVLGIPQLRSDVHSLQTQVAETRSLVDHAITIQRDHEREVNFPLRPAVSSVEQ